MPDRLQVAITLGDPAGIGPEIVQQALASGELPEGVNYQILGETEGYLPGRPDLASAQAAFAALEESARLVLSGAVSAVVTGPVAKKNLHAAGFTFPGQTEFFAARAGIDDFAMLLTGGKLTVVLATCHIPLGQVVRVLSAERILRSGSLLAEYLLALGLPLPRIAVAGLNPHAGEEGEMGTEEQNLIQPAVSQLRSRLSGRAVVEGPFSPDTIFYRAVAGEFDGVVCMYHDQGLIPLKLHAFHEGVNVTLGLPFVRTSPDHGTAFALAGKGSARPDSMIQAIRLAVKLAKNPPRSMLGS